MCRIAVELPNEVLYDTKMTQKEAEAFVRKSVAMCYYLQNHISIGYCSKIAGMNEEEFINYLGANGVSIFSFDDENEFEEELANA